MDSRHRSVERLDVNDEIASDAEECSQNSEEEKKVPDLEEQIFMRRAEDNKEE